MPRPLALLAEGGVDVSRVRTQSAATGVAFIAVAASGENATLSCPARMPVDPLDVPDALPGAAAVVLLQNEVPTSANATLVARAARRRRVIYNAAPARLDCALLDRVSVLVANETEMQAIARDHGVPDNPKSFSRAIATRWHGATTIVTLGDAGAIAADGERSYTVAAPHVDVVDTTGAGDAFVGALAAALDRRLPLREALTSAVAAGSLACTRHGAPAFVAERARNRADRRNALRRRARCLTPRSQRGTDGAVRCRTHSNRQTAAAAAALSDSVRPGIGWSRASMRAPRVQSRAPRLRCRTRTRRDRSTQRRTGSGHR